MPTHKARSCTGGHLNDTRCASMRSWFWAALVPILTVVLVSTLGLIGLCTLLLYGIVWARTFFIAKQQLNDAKSAALWASAALSGSLPSYPGKFFSGGAQLFDKTPQLIEYKGSA